jgi:CheY-like chemotaxis protein
MVEKTDVKKLLLVDDEVGYLDVLAKRLTHRGFEVTTASSGAEAIRALRNWEFDLAVVDLKMEDMDGIEVLKVLKKMERWYRPRSL